MEHAVTELLTGLDLVELQLRVAAREPLPLQQQDVVVRGHAIECRINAEDPAQGFRPAPGVVHELSFPEGVRVDTYLSAGDRIPPNYDSMIAKVLTWGDDRAEAMARMRAALAEARVTGPVTNIELHRRILGWEPFVSGRYDTTSLERDLALLVGEGPWRA